ncbi:MAG: class I SAM-dependent methyltransferase [Parvibaculaceae bacterium]
MKPPPPPDSATLRFYAETAETYSASGSGGTNRHLKSFLEKLKPGARILELGCGGGRDAEAMIAAGFIVDPTDGTAEIARTAETRLKRPVRVMRFDELDADNIYDAVWASASLLHVPREALPNILALIFKALKPDGLHFASYKSGDGEGRDGHGRYFNFPTRADLIGFYSQSAAWKIETVEERMGGNYDGERVPWIAVTARKVTTSK